MKNILFVVEDKKSPQYRYRVKNVRESLEASKKFETECITTDKLLNFEKINKYDIIVFLRQAIKSEKILKFIKVLKNQEKIILLDIDDLVFNYWDLLLVTRTIDTINMAYWTSYFWGIRRIAKLVNGFVTTNDFLGKRLEKCFGKPYGVIRNSLNREQVEVSDECLNKKYNLKNSGKKDDDFVIGYFSGSPTHRKDFAVAEKAIFKMLTNYPNVHLKIVGYMKFSEQVEQMIEDKKISYLPMMNFKDLQREIAKVDVNIAPLVINDFTNCKSELKFFEAGAVETTTIASPTYTFRQAIRDGENGFLAQPGEWYDKLEYLYNHPEENRKIAKQARKDALKHYYGKEFLQEVEKVYDRFAKLT